MRGGGRRHQAHEVVKLAMKRMVRPCPDPIGCAFPKESILIEPAHLRQVNRALVTSMQWELDSTKKKL